MTLGEARLFLCAGNKGAGVTSNFLFFSPLFCKFEYTRRKQILLGNRRMRIPLSAHCNKYKLQKQQRSVIPQKPQSQKWCFTLIFLRIWEKAVCSSYQQVFSNIWKSISTVHLSEGNDKRGRLAGRVGDGEMGVFFSVMRMFHTVCASAVSGVLVNIIRHNFVFLFVSCIFR